MVPLIREKRCSQWRLNNNKSLAKTSTRTRQQNNCNKPRHQLQRKNDKPDNAKHIKVAWNMTLPTALLN